MELISTNTASGTVSSINFSSIPQTYSHLIVMVSALGTAGGHTLQMTLNDDTANGHRYASPYFGSTLASNGTSTGVAYFDLMLVGDNTPNWGAGSILIPNYASTSTRRIILGTNTHEGGSGYYGGFSPSSVTNVTSIRFTKSSIAATTTISLYGVK